MPIARKSHATSVQRRVVRNQAGAELAVWQCREGEGEGNDEAHEPV